MKPLILVIALLWGIVGKGFAAATTQELELATTQGDTLYGTLLLPEGKQPCPIVLLIAGSGPTDRNGNSAMGNLANNSLKMVAEALAGAGIGSLRYDKRGIAASRAAGTDEAQLRFDHYVRDAQEWIDLLHTLPRCGSVCVAGHSEGSLIGMLACQGRAQQVKGFISLAGPGSPADQIVERQVADQPEEIRRLVADINASLRRGETVSPIPPYLYALFRPQVQPYLISWYRYTPLVVLMTLSCPSLIVQGTTDLQVPADEAAKLKQLTPGVRVVMVEGMNHVLKACDTTERQAQLATYADPELPLHPELMGKIVEFVKAIE